MWTSRYRSGPRSDDAVVYLTWAMAGMHFSLAAVALFLCGRSHGRRRYHEAFGAAAACMFIGFVGCMYVAMARKVETLHPYWRPVPTVETRDR